MAAEDSDGSEATELIFSIGADGDRDPVVPSIGRYSSHEAIPLSRNLRDVGNGELHPLRWFGTFRSFTTIGYRETADSQQYHRQSKRFVHEPLLFRLTPKEGEPSTMLWRPATFARSKD